MSVSLTFSIAFHGPFRVATGRAKPGVDASVDLANPLPATALKGLARHCAQVQLGVPPELVNAVFGTPVRPSPWGWSDAEFPPGALTSNVQAQVRIDPLTGTADSAERALMFGEQLWCRPGVVATVEVDCTTALSGDDLDDQLSVIVGSFCSVHSLGSSRRRGLGRVTIRLDNAHGARAERALGKNWAAQVARSLAARTVW